MGASRKRAAAWCPLLLSVLHQTLLPQQLSCGCFAVGSRRLPPHGLYFADRIGQRLFEGNANATADRMNEMTASTDHRMVDNDN